ncbi:MAG: DUF2339 domain-containing protein [Planctomycetes bacterium]|nr:DUF2339 domain-containing protein [Planctomycetota bacterium]
MHLELNRTVGFTYVPLKLPVLTLLWLVPCGFLLRESIRRDNPVLQVLLGFTVVVVLVKLFIIDLTSWKLVPPLVYPGNQYSLHDALIRLLDFGAVIVFLTISYSMVSNRKASQSQEQDAMQAIPFFGVTAMGVLFVFFSLELNTFLLITMSGIRPGGVSILWSVFALSWLLRGIQKNNRALRYSGLTLFVIVVIKVFMRDLSELDSFYRIIAFIVLGIVVLAGSAVYLKFRENFAVTQSNREEYEDGA